MHEGNPSDFEWDVVSGISGGAINTGALSVWAKEDGLAMSEWLSQTWNDLRTPDVWTWWPGGPIAGFSQQSLLDDTPLVEFLRETLGAFPDGVSRRTLVGTVDANNAAYVTWNLDEIPKDQFLEVGPHKIVSSASLPGLFIP